MAGSSTTNLVAARVGCLLLLVVVVARCRCSLAGLRAARPAVLRSRVFCAAFFVCSGLTLGAHFRLLHLPPPLCSVITCPFCLFLDVMLDQGQVRHVFFLL